MSSTPADIFMCDPAQRRHFNAYENAPTSFLKKASGSQIDSGELIREKTNFTLAISRKIPLASPLEISAFTFTERDWIIGSMRK
jgi:hypothetical protein